MYIIEAMTKIITNNCRDWAIWLGNSD
uniref:Uncharacterized protein n=1 Tax=Anguilla anguilla TaxID=7936 RepID=A0A0E9UKJ4_ANGAN